MKDLNALSNSELLDSTRLHLQRSCELDADLLLLLGEIDARRLYLDRAFATMFDFCTGELGFSEDVTYNRLKVAGLVRRFPRVLDVVRSGKVHLTGLRLLEPHLTEENLDVVLAEATGKSKRSIEELVARLAPQLPVPTSIRRLPERAAVSSEEPTPLTEPASLPLLAIPAPPEREETPGAAQLPTPAPRRAEVRPLSAATYEVRFTASLALKVKLEQAEELLRHRIDRGDLADVIERAVDLLIDEVKKERFGVGRQARTTAEEAEEREDVTRHVPAAISREVYARDGGRCTFVSEDGRRCEERGGLELEHIEGFARTGRHAVEGLTLHCRAHNQHCADKLYGREFMQAKRRPGTENQTALL
jgi:hypothetical protein